MRQPIQHSRSQTLYASVITLTADLDLSMPTPPLQKHQILHLLSTETEGLVPRTLPHTILSHIIAWRVLVPETHRQSGDIRTDDNLAQGLLIRYTQAVDPLARRLFDVVRLVSPSIIEIEVDRRQPPGVTGVEDIERFVVELARGEGEHRLFDAWGDFMLGASFLLLPGEVLVDDFNRAVFDDEVFVDAIAEFGGEIEEAEGR